jgi:thiol-disulfide isomerase/thioredoxin
LIGAMVLAASVAVAQSWAGQPWLGVMLQPGTKGVVVKVVPDTPAAKAGLEDGDEILAIDKTKTKTTSDLIETVAKHRVGDEVVLKVLRGKKTIDMPATLGQKPDTRDVTRKALIDRKAPEFDLAVLDGEGRGDFDDYDGKVVVVEFFATWCKYCPLMHKKLSALQTKYKDDVIVVGIGSDDKQKLLNYLDPDFEPKKTTAKIKDPRTGVEVERVIHIEPHYGHLGFRALHDDGEKVKGAYWVTTLPTVVVIDRDGFVRDIGVGASNAVARQIQRSVATLVDDDN